MGRGGEFSRITEPKHAENPSTARDFRTPPEPKSSIDSESESDRERRRRKSSKRKTSRKDDSDSELESDSDSDRERRRKRKKSRNRKSSRRRYTDSESESSESDSESESDGDRKSRKKRKSSRRRHSDSESESVSESDSDRDRRRSRKRREKDRKKRKTGGDDDDDDERRGKRKKKEKRKKDRKKNKKKGKTGAVTNTWGKYGIVRENDMWNKRPEFSAWLSEIKQVNLESLPTRDEKIMFKEYMEDYNTATFPSKKYYDLDAYHRRKLEKQMKQGFKKASNTERLVFNDEEQRRQEIQQAREKEKEKEVIAKMEYMKSGMAEDMKEQRRLQEEMAYLFKIGNVEAATAIQRKLEPDVPM